MKIKKEIDDQWSGKLPISLNAVFRIAENLDLKFKTSFRPTKDGINLIHLYDEDKKISMFYSLDLATLFTASGSEKLKESIVEIDNKVNRRLLI